jgi:uncharacterized protein (DUF58 family)
VLPVLPTARLLALVAAAAVLFLAGDAVALAADAALAAAFLLDAILAPRPGQLRVARRVPTRLPLGGEADVVWMVENATPRTLRLLVTDDLPGSLDRVDPAPGTTEGVDVFQLVIAPRSSARAVYRIRARERGAATLGDVHLRVQGPLGLVWRRIRVPLADTVRALPGLAETRRYRLLGLHRRLAAAGVRVTRQRVDRGAFESLREYLPGDDPRTIDWKATARRGTHIVRRFEAERSQNVLLAIDAGRLMLERIDGRERIDHALAAALLLADVAAAHGDRVGLLVFADRVERFLPPARVSIAQLADTLAGVQPRLVEPNYPAAFAHIAKRLRRRSLVVLFTDVIDVRASAALIAHVSRSAARHLPLALALRNPELDAAALAMDAPGEDVPGASVHGTEAGVYRRAAAEELLQARAVALAAMRRAGVLVADALPREAIPAVVNRYLQVKRDGLL